MDTLGISGAGLTYMLTPPSLRFNLGDTFLHDDVSAIQGLFIEFILTLIFTLSVYAATDIRHSKGYLRSLFYGFAVTLCSLIGVSILVLSALLFVEESAPRVAH